MNVTFADITLPLWLVASQWTLLFALGFLVIVMYRQLGFLLSLRDLGTEREGLPIGEKAPAFGYTPLNGSVSPSARIAFTPKGIWSFLLFVDPGCAGCRGTLPALEQLIPTFEQGMRVLVVTTAGPILIDEINVFKTASIDIYHVDKDVPNELYRTRSTPFAYLVDPDGIIQAKGVATDEDEIRKIVQKGDRSTIGMESITS